MPGPLSMVAVGCNRFRGACRGGARAARGAVRRWGGACLLAVALMAVVAGIPWSAARAAGPDVIPAGQLPDDARLGPLKDLNGYFPMAVPASVEAWTRRAAELRLQTRVSQGLWPEPTRTPLNPQVFGKVERDGYTVERVILESVPGHYVTGSLYRPAAAATAGKRPGVLCPHGHWPNGRFYDAGEARVRQDIVVGAERFEVGGRFPLQARCVTLARMGCVVFHYDMEGYADSVQLEHRAGERPALNTPENWGYFSPQAELRLQTMMGLQSWNSVRALDFLLSLEEVDAGRIGVTGASGGGTQTFVLGAVDDRPTALFPVVMVSTAMQGGCTCENASYLRVGTGNIELAGLVAPKPLGMVAADDWTRELMTKGYPELQQLYALLGAKDRVLAKANVHFPHNYNYVTRAVMYAFFNKHLGLKLPEPVIEQDFVPLTQAELSVWDAEHPQPAKGDDHERALVRWFTEDQQRQLAALAPRDAASLAAYRETVGGAWTVLLANARRPDGKAITWDNRAERDAGSYLEFAGTLRDPARGAEVPVVFLHPKQWNGRLVVWASTAGKGGLYGTDGGLRSEVARLVEAGCSVAGIDVLGTGEFTADGRPVAAQRLVESGRDLWKAYPGYTYGYNPSLLAHRTHDLLTLLAYARQYEEPPRRIDLVAVDGAAPWTLAAAFVAGDAVAAVAADTGGFRFAGLVKTDDPDFVSGSVKYGDLPGLAALLAPRPLWLGGEAESPALTRAAYTSAAAAEALTAEAGEPARRAARAVDWLLTQEK